MDVIGFKCINNYAADVGNMQTYYARLIEGRQLILFSITSCFAFRCDYSWVKPKISVKIDWERDFLAVNWGRYPSLLAFL